MQGLLGIVVLLGLAWLVSEDRRGVSAAAIAVGLAMQFVLALALLRFAPVRDTLLLANHVVYAIEAATRAGTTFVFGFLGGGDPPFDLTNGSAMYIFGFRILPQIVVFSVLVALTWYWRILPLVIKALRVGVCAERSALAARWASARVRACSSAWSKRRW